MAGITSNYQLHVADIDAMRRSEKRRNHIKSVVGGVILGTGTAHLALKLQRSDKFVKSMKSTLYKAANKLTNKGSSYFSLLKNGASHLLNAMAKNPKTTIFAGVLLAALEVNHFITKRIAYKDGQIDQKYDDMLGK